MTHPISSTQTSSTVAGGFAAFLAAMSQYPMMPVEHLDVDRFHQIEISQTGRNESSEGASVILSAASDIDWNLQADLRAVFHSLTIAQSDIEPEFQQVVYSNRSELYTLF